MKSNYVIVISNGEKHFAFTESYSANTNLWPKFQAQEQYGQVIKVVHWCPSKKKANALAENWNKAYKLNGTNLY